MAAPMISKRAIDLCSNLSRLCLAQSGSGFRNLCNNTIRSKWRQIFFLGSSRNPVSSTQAAALIHTSSSCSDLNEFFDKKSNWGEPSIRVGRPYRLDELRLKSNTDLHKLWYVLLKERNMLMTMAEEYKRQNELFPNPERLEKVEESMENLLDVVRERDTALSMLETGEPPNQTRKRWTYNELGIGYWRKYQEHFMPIHHNAALRRANALSGPWQQQYLRLYREQKLKQRAKAIRKVYGHARRLKSVFPNANIEPNYEQFESFASKMMRGPESRLDVQDDGIEGKKVSN